MPKKMWSAAVTVDPYNRLVIGKTGKKSDLTKFRKVIDGRFKIDSSNALSYHVKAPLSETETIPHQLKIRGRWALTANHDLQLTVDKSGRDTFGDQMTLQGEILDVNESSLLFAVTTKIDENKQSTYILNLRGSWRADEHNRLSFRIKKEKSRSDILTLNGAWEINKNHQIIYQYEKADLIRKRKRLHTLIFKGYWDIKDKFRISYVLSKSAGSLFDFQTSVAVFGEDYIKYELGIGLANKGTPAKQTLTLYGKWRLKKDLGLTFEIEYEDKKTHEMVFGLELSRKILRGDGEAFLRILKSGHESAIYAGAAWRW